MTGPFVELTDLSVVTACKPVTAITGPTTADTERKVVTAVSPDTAPVV